jgi:hypothetical protein
MSEIKEKMIEEDGKLHIVRTQEVGDILKANKRAQDDAPSMHGDAKFRLVGRIPNGIAEQWMKECGAVIGTQEFTQYVKKKLKDPDYAYLKIKNW